MYAGFNAANARQKNNLYVHMFVTVYCCSAIIFYQYFRANGLWNGFILDFCLFLYSCLSQSRRHWIVVASSLVAKLENCHLVRLIREPLLSGLAKIRTNTNAIYTKTKPNIMTNIGDSIWVVQRIKYGLTGIAKKYQSEQMKKSDDLTKAINNVRKQV